MEIKNRMVLEFLSHSENVGVARVAIASFAAQLDFTLNDIEEIKVAVSEAVSNAIIHGYRDELGIVRVTAILTTDELEITVEDQGQGIPNVELARRPSYTTQPERMGLGFVFIESFMDHVEISSRPGHGTLVKMVKRIPKTSRNPN